MCRSWSSLKMKTIFGLRPRLATSGCCESLAAQLSPLRPARRCEKARARHVLMVGLEERNGPLSILRPNLNACGVEMLMPKADTGEADFTSLSTHATCLTQITCTSNDSLRSDRP